MLGGPQGGPTAGEGKEMGEWSQETARRPPQNGVCVGYEARWDITPPKIEMTSRPQVPGG